jgi:hypothetical protein
MASPPSQWQRGENRCHAAWEAYPLPDCPRVVDLVAERYPKSNGLFNDLVVADWERGNGGEDRCNLAAIVEQTAEGL